MAVPKAFAKLRTEQQAEAKREAAVNKRIHDYRKEEEKSTFASLVAALKPYHKADLDKDKITIKVRPAKREIDLLVNGKFWTKLYIRREFSSCHCEGPCGCRVDTWVAIKSEPFFYCQDWKSEDLVAKAFSDNLRSYHENEQWKEIRRKEKKNGNS